MSGYYGYPTVATGYCAPTQPVPPTGMASAVNAGYPMLAPALTTPVQPVVAPPGMPAYAMPATYPGVYNAAAAMSVQPMPYQMVQQPQQQQIAPMFQQPAVFPTMPPPMPPQQQQQVAWQTIQPSSAATSNYQPVARQQLHRFQHPRQHQQIRSAQTQQIRPAQTQQIRPAQTQQIRPAQTQQQRPLRMLQQQQQFQRPQLRPRVPTLGGPRGQPPAAQALLRPAAPRPAGTPGSATTVGSIGRMRAPAQQKQPPPPLFSKTNLRPVVTAGGPAAGGKTAASADASNDGELPHCPPIPGAVGTEYVVQIRTDQRGAAALQYHCRLCDCRFIDQQARDLHVKGRRHRLQFKRKVDPRISVDAKPGVKARPAGLGTQDSVAAAAAAVPSETATMAASRRRREEEQRVRDMQELEWSIFAGCKHGGFWGSGVGQPRRPESNDDRQVLAKHSSVYPTEAELHAVQHLVTRCERALKLASDHLSNEAEANAPPLRGVMRVGALAKGLLLHGDLATQLVLLCASWPTRELRDRIVQLLPERLETGGSADAPQAADKPESSAEEQPQSEQLQVRLDDEEGCIVVQQCSAENGGLELTCSVYLTSPAVREEAGADNPEPEGSLDRDKCLEALAALRQAKWFQAKASSLQSCVPVIRVMRDMCQRLPIWGPLPNWAMELLVERCISSASVGQLLSPGEAIRRVMECLASGVLLPSGPGLRDPCEKSPVDAAASMSAQEREDLTASAQQALRFIAFRQLHRVLDMAPLVAPVTPAGAAAPAAAVKRPAAPPPAAAGASKQARIE